MGKPRNKKVQPYILFCTEQEQTVKELSGKTIPQLVELCSEAWSSLDSGRRQRYVDMAKEYTAKGYFCGTASSSVPDGSGGPADDLTGKFDCYGRSELAKQEERRRAKFWKDAMKADVDARIERAKNDNRIPQMVIHIASINTWLELDTGEVIPSEIGMVRMSVQDGVIERYNQMVGPGVMPVGYKSDAMTNSQKYHKIWLDNPELSENYKTIVDAILDAVKVSSEDGASVPRGTNVTRAGLDIDIERRCKRENVDMSPAALAAVNYQLCPIYVMSHEMERVRKGFKWLCDKASEQEEEKEVKVEFTFYDLPYFFWRMIEEAPYEYQKKITLTVAEAHLKSDVFLYVRGVSCRFHDSVESCCCAGGRATRLAFVVCDFCCQLYSQRPLEGRHVPNGIPVVDYVSEQSLEVGSGGSFSRSLQRDLRPELEMVPSRSSVELTMDEGQRFSDKHPLSNVLIKRDGEYFVRGAAAANTPLPHLPARVLEQLEGASAAASKASMTGTFYSMDDDPHSIRNLVAAASSIAIDTGVEDDTMSFVSAQEKWN